MLIDQSVCEHVGRFDSQAMLARRPAWVGGNISESDQPLLIGLTKLLQPRKVVEIGVASGWSGCLFVDALRSNRQSAEYIGIDYSPTFYLDKSRKTGAALGELFPDPDHGVACRLLLGAVAVDVLDAIGPGVDLAFIDGDHHHPWAVLDLLSLLPVLAPSAYVLMHDLNLSTFERHKHANRGPKYLYEGWPLEKLHSSQKPPMIGAIKMPVQVDAGLLTRLLDIVYTPWEVAVDASVLDKTATVLGKQFGNDWGRKFKAAFDELNAATRRPQPAISAASRQRVTSALIEAASKQADAARSVSLLAAACELLPSDWQLWHHLAVASHRARDHAAALEASLRSDQLQPGNAHVKSFQGQILLDLGRLEEAERCMRMATAAGEGVVIFHVRLAKLLHAMRRDDEARAAARHACALAPDDQSLDSLITRLATDAGPAGDPP